MGDLSNLTIELTDVILPWIAILISVVITMWFKDIANNIAKGLSFKMKPGFEPGDRVFLDGEEAVIISIGIRETIFEFQRECGKCWRYVPNSRTEYLKLEKIVGKD